MEPANACFVTSWRTGLHDARAGLLSSLTPLGAPRRRAANVETDPLAVLVADQRRRGSGRRAVLARADLRGARDRRGHGRRRPVAARAVGRAAARRSRCSAASHGADLRHATSAASSSTSTALRLIAEDAVRQGRLAAGDQAHLPRPEQVGAGDARCRAAIRPTSCRRSRSACCRSCRPTRPTSATRRRTRSGHRSARRSAPTCCTIIGGVLFAARRR